MLELIIAPSLDIELHETYNNLRAGYYTQRTQMNEELLEKVDTGMVSKRTFGYNVNPV